LLKDDTLLGQIGRGVIKDYGAFRVAKKERKREGELKGNKNKRMERKGTQIYKVKF